MHRYAEHELGLRLDHLEPLLPDFRYRAVDASGIVEHEVCPVWLAQTTSAPSLNRDEAVEARELTGCGVGDVPRGRLDRRAAGPPGGAYQPRLQRPSIW